MAIFFSFIGIRQLQLILFKVALMLGVEIHVNLEFVKVLEPPEDQENQSTINLIYLCSSFLISPLHLFYLYKTQYFLYIWTHLTS